ncbi:UNVERIFIED_CONTAM: hypothetical protein GTU68_038824 [Idotea baltica]|nr:hypothetical protein [Idotea baltica]
MGKLRIASYNVNGIRAASKKGFAEWLKEADLDVVCLQEIKANKDQIEKEEKALEDLGYQCFWYSAQKKGYSGTAIITRLKPDEIVYGCEHELFDFEGRVIRMDYKGLSIISAYFPSGSSGDERQEIKMQFLDFAIPYFNKLRDEKQQLIIAGDYNIAHTEIDIHNPKSNKNNSGFLPEERAWMDTFFGEGYTDTFRYINKAPHNYSWWSYRGGARDNNKGWRIDYISVTENLSDKITNAQILNEVKHSDHCPIMVELKM